MLRTPRRERERLTVYEKGQHRAGHAAQLEQRLLQAAEDLLAHEGRRVMSVTFPGAEPPLFIVIGETPQLVELLAAATRELKGED